MSSSVAATRSGTGLFALIFRISLGVIALSIGGMMALVEHELGHVRAELDRLQFALHREPPISDRRGQLYAAQQALAWALDPGGIMSPLALIERNAGGSADCWAETRQAA